MVTIGAAIATLLTSLPPYFLKTQLTIGISIFPSQLIIYILPLAILDGNARHDRPS
jgi:hypothetical protein